MGGSGGGGVRWPKPRSIQRQVAKAAQRADDSAFGAELGEYLGTLLAQVNSRDTEQVASRLSKVKSTIERDVEGVVDARFGGSVSKHTYVDGLSDVDCLLTLDKTELADAQPKQVLRYLEDLLRKKLGKDVSVTSGQLAITLKFSDGMEIQCLPALRTKEGVRIPSALHKNKWSDIDPEKFQSALTRHNQACGGKLVPTIKLAKAINAMLPEGRQLSGYHIEALAIAAFRDYRSEFIPNKMLPHFFDRSSSLVRSPIRDSTGQSVNVDDYLGSENSAERQQVSQAFSRIAKKMRNATASEDLNQWKALFDE